MQPSKFSSEHANDWKKDWNNSMIKRLVHRKDLTPENGQGLARTNFEDYYSDEKNEQIVGKSPELQRL